MAGKIDALHVVNLEKIFPALRGRVPGPSVRTVPPLGGALALQFPKSDFHVAINRLYLAFLTFPMAPEHFCELVKVIFVVLARTSLRSSIARVIRGHPDP